MAGFGLQPAGTSNAGFGTPPQAYEPLGVITADATGQATGARAIDPVAKDYVISSTTGRLLGMGATQQVVTLAVTTEKLSSAVRDMGHELRKIDRITDNIQARVLTTLTAALQTAIDLKLVQVLGLSMFRAGPKDGLREGRVYGRLRLRDVTTGQEFDEVI